jgi:hypothetical protein
MLWGLNEEQGVNWARFWVFKAVFDNRNPRNTGEFTGSQDIYGSHLIDRSVDI